MDIKLYCLNDIIALKQETLNWEFLNYIFHPEKFFSASLQKNIFHISAFQTEHTCNTEISVRGQYQLITRCDQYSKRPLIYSISNRKHGPLNCYILYLYVIRPSIISFQGIVTLPNPTAYAQRPKCFLAVFIIYLIDGYFTQGHLINTKCTSPEKTARSPQ